MRGKRSKQYKKLMSTFGLVFGFREPYQVLIDAQMVQDAERFSMDLVGGLEKVLHGQIKPMLTQCSMRHLYTLSTLPQSQKDNLIMRAKTWERRRCNHHTLSESLSTLECLSSVIDPKGSKTNKNRYVIASQSEEVRRYCRGIQGVPLIYIKRSVMVMEPMAEASLGAREGFEKGKFRAGIRGKHLALGIKRKRQDEASESDSNETPTNDAHDTAVASQQEQHKKKKVKGPKGPNPLSVKKARVAKDEKKADIGIETRQRPTMTDNAAVTESDVAGEDPDIIEHPQNEDAEPQVKRKRKRKHKTKGLEELKPFIEEDGDLGPNKLVLS